MKTNEYYPITRIAYPINYIPLEKGGEKYVVDMEVAAITIICNRRNDVISVVLEGDKNYDKAQYLSLKRFKGKIAWKYHFIPNEE